MLCIFSLGILWAEFWDLIVLFPDRALFNLLFMLNLTRLIFLLYECELLKPRASHYTHSLQKYMKHDIGIESKHTYIEDNIAMSGGQINDRHRMYSLFLQNICFS